MVTKREQIFSSFHQCCEMSWCDKSFSLFISVAKCLGARTVAAKALEWTQNHNIINHVCSDQEAVLACERFAGEKISFPLHLMNEILLKSVL